MLGISRDTVLADRYALETCLAAREGLEHWTARDRTLDREVAVTVFAGTDSRADAALDSARRAAGVEDSRLIRILDVGREGEHAYIVEEGLHDATSLALLLRSGPLPAEEVRRIVGEAATALEVARARGLHHLRLTPHAVLRTKEGGVRVSGLAVAAALDAADDLPSADASRQDAVGLVALIYAGLTATWPLSPAVSGIESARRLAGGGVREPADVHDDRGQPTVVPADLNTVCRLTLRSPEDGGHPNDGPRTPGELARQLAPWSSEQVNDLTRSAGWAAASPVSADERGDDTSRPEDDTSRPEDDATRPGDDTTQVDDGDGADDSEGIGTAYGAAAADRLESPMPLLPGSVVADPSSDQAKIALGLVAAFVVVALLLAYCNSPISKRTEAAAIHSQTTTQPTPTTGSPSPSPSTTASASATPTAKEPTGPIKIKSAALLDPAANSIENPDTVHWTIDGNPNTRWTSWGTGTADFNGNKDGVGLVFDLGKARTVHAATLDLPLPNGLTVYVSDTPERSGATPLGTSDGKSGSVTIKAGATAPKGRYVIVWFTGLVKDTQYYHASLADISLK